MKPTVWTRGVALALAAVAQSLHAQAAATPPIVGRWDLTITGGRGSYASWLEVERSGFGALVGRFTGRIGGMRPIGRVEWRGDTVRFSIPPQWDNADADLRFEGRLEGDRLTGTITNPNGAVHRFTGRRAPSLRRASKPVWGAPVALFNARTLEGWVPDQAGPNQWAVRDGVLTNAAPGANLETTQRFDDFQLHVEFRYPKGGDSGVMLRGRYEVQIRDDPERELPTRESIGGVYGFLGPSENAARAPGEWQTFDLTLVGRHVTVVLNGKTVIANQIIPGLTGSAVDADEGAPGPIVLQGEESALEFRNITIRVPRGATTPAGRAPQRQ